MTQAFHLLLGLQKISLLFWDFKIRNSFWITKGSDNEDSDNRGSTVYNSLLVITDINIHTYANIYTYKHIHYTVDAVSSFTGCFIVPDSTKMFSTQYPTTISFVASSLSSVYTWHIITVIMWSCDYTVYVVTL